MTIEDLREACDRLVQRGKGHMDVYAYNREYGPREVSDLTNLKDLDQDSLGLDQGETLEGYIL